MRTAFIDTLTQLMNDHDDIIAITADMGFSVFEDMQKKFTKRFINTGVTEQSSMGLAAGLALSGYKVFFYAQAAFATMRCFEQVRLDVGYNHVNVKIIGTAAGFSLNQLGVSHFAVEDIGLMRLIPKMTIFTPGDPFEARWATEKAYQIDGPVYLRLTNGGTPVVHTEKIKIKIGDPIQLAHGKDLTLFVSGSLLPQSMEVVDLLAQKGLKASLYSTPTVKPLNEKVICQIIEKSKIIFSLEEHSIIGGLGDALAEIVAESGSRRRLCRLGVRDIFTGITGSHNFLLDYNGLSADKLFRQIQICMKYDPQKNS